jgi:hypothetical protein
MPVTVTLPPLVNKMVAVLETPFREAVTVAV